MCICNEGTKASRQARRAISLYLTIDPHAIYTIEKVSAIAQTTVSLSRPRLETLSLSDLRNPNVWASSCVKRANRTAHKEKRDIRNFRPESQHDAQCQKAEQCIFSSIYRRIYFRECLCNLHNSRVRHAARRRERRGNTWFEGKRARGARGCL